MIWSYVIDKVRMAICKPISANQDRIHQRNLKTLTYKMSKSKNKLSSEIMIKIFNFKECS